MKEKNIKRNEGLLWFGGWTSEFGNIIFDYANNVSIVGAFASKPWILAIYQSSETVIQILFNLIGGAKADKGSRKRIVIVTDILAAIICGLLSIFVDSVWMAQIMVIANALLAVVYAFNSPTYKAMIREVIERERIGFYNSIANAGSGLIGIVGPIAGVALVGVIGARGALIFDAITFLVSALAEVLLVRVVEPQMKEAVKKNVFLDIRDGFLYLWKEKQILFLVILASLVNFFLAGYNLLLPYLDMMYEAGSGYYSKALAMQAIGGIISSAILARRVDHFKDKVRAMILFLFGTGLVLVLVPVVPLLPFAFFGAFLTGFNVLFMSHVQVAVEESYLGRVFSIIFTVAVLFMPVGSMVFSIVLKPENILSFLLVGGGIVILSLISLVHHCRNSWGKA